MCSPVLAGFLLDEFEAQVVEQHEAQADAHQHQVAGVERILVHAHGLHHLQQRQRERYGMCNINKTNSFNLTTFTQSFQALKCYELQSFIIFFFPSSLLNNRL